MAYLELNLELYVKLQFAPASWFGFECETQSGIESETESGTQCEIVLSNAEEGLPHSNDQEEWLDTNLLSQ